jgi:hypothetical protein
MIKTSARKLTKNSPETRRNTDHEAGTGCSRTHPQLTHPFSAHAARRPAAWTDKGCASPNRVRHSKEIADTGLLTAPRAQGAGPGA